MNVPEAQALVAEARKLIVEQGYDGSIGVVTPFRAQANRIRTLAQQDAELVGAARGGAVRRRHGPRVSRR